MKDLTTTSPLPKDLEEQILTEYYEYVGIYQKKKKQIPVCEHCGLDRYSPHKMIVTCSCNT